jgi:hypothetical protein
MTRTKFRGLIGGYLLCVGLAIAGHVLGVEKLPLALREFVVEADKTTWLVGWMGYGYLAAATIACIGLLLFRHWARPLFVAVTLFGLMPWDGATVYPPLEYLFVHLEFVFAGAIIAAAYWSPVKDSFVAKP